MVDTCSNPLILPPFEPLSHCAPSGPNHVPQFGLVLSWRRHKDTPRVEGRVRSFHVEKFGALEHGFFDLRTAAAPGKNDNKLSFYCFF
jgi:hypothetical protein